MDLEQRWLSLPWPTTAKEGAVRRAFRRIVTAYQGKGRAYHTLRHIEECLSEFDRARRLATAPLSLELAIWYHDIVYRTDPEKAPVNEAQSAGFAVIELKKLGFDLAFGMAVALLIMATKHDSKPTSLKDDFALIHDIDLAIFGQSRRRVAEYEAEIWDEYSWARGLAQARRSRALLLKAFLDRRRVYLTDFFAQRHAKRARANLEWLVTKNS